MKNIFLTSVLAAGLFCSPVYAETLNVSVAVNFAKVLEDLGADFKSKTGHELKLSSGPTGKLYAQIVNGGPYDLFFAADVVKPQALVKDGLAVEGSYMLYAQGVLALWSPSLPVKEHYKTVLEKAEFNHLAIANPKVAPYGAEAIKVMQELGVYDTVKPKVVNGESLAHAFQYVQTGNASLGFLALSQLVDPESPAFGKGQYWLPPQEMYAHLDQAAVILKRAENNPAAAAFWAYMRSDDARAIIQRYGYKTP
ncbi:MAG: molybdate ABC transporter substrate-binding protein [Halothiobacillaceae bacterium]